MLDINFIRQNLELVKAGVAAKNITIDFSRLLQLDDQRRHLIQEVDKLREIKNQANKKIPTLSDQDKKEAFQELQAVSAQEKELNQELHTLETQQREIMLQVPNLPSKSTPIGKDESENLVVSQWGELPKFEFQPLDHATLGLLTDTIDTERAAVSSGARFTYLKNQAVLLQFALVQHILQKLAAHNFTPVIPPVLVKEEAMEATGFFPADKEQIYNVNPEEDNLYLVGTSEVPLTMLHYKQTLEADQLPLRYVGYSSCFRREAGSYGKDTKGILRLHQFDKLEMYSFCHPDLSEQEHDFIRSLEEEIMQDLKLPYQVINICSGDLGNPATKKYDLEVYIPSQEKYRELTSASNCTDFQSRRSQIKYRNPKTQKTEFLHTLNGTACAVGRTLIAIYENYQTANHSIQIPEILQPYLPFTEIKAKVKT